MKRLLPILLLAGSCTPRLMPVRVPTYDNYVCAEGFAQDSIFADEAWWTLFGDPTLDSLVRRALDNNRDIAAAAAAVEQARAQRAIARARFLPQFGAEIDAGGDYDAQTKIVQSYAVEPTLEWEISLFGALRQADRAARAALASSEWALRGMRLSVAAEVATTYFTLSEYRSDLEIARRSRTLRSESAALIGSMFRYGMSDGVALEQARSLLYTAEADIPLYERSLEQTALSLNTLTGDVPQREVPATNERLSGDRQLPEIPVGLPSELLVRRPDIIEARYRVVQTAAQAGAARSARFPSLLLTAKGGIAAASIKGLTASNPWAWSAVGGLTEPIFAFGKLKRSEQAAIAQYDQAARNYEQTVLEAFSDVEQALTAIRTYRIQRERVERLVEANERIAVMERALFRSGMTDYLDVIDAERSLYDSQKQLVDITTQQYIAYVGLCKALGGGFRMGR